MKTAVILGIIIACIGLTYFYPHTMISPGELTAGHRTLNKKCQACHTIFSGVPDSKCISCHKPSEIGRDTLNKNDLTRFKIPFHQLLSVQSCTSCHTDHNGRFPKEALSNFKHDLLAETVKNQCGSCHNKPVDSLHQFISASCAGCHNTNGWKLPAAFNHDMIQAAVRSNCTSCHQKPADAFHRVLTANCDKCHSTGKWVPATFDHAKYFQLDRNHNATCITCHKNNNFATYTCYGCHEHTESDIIAEHNEEGIYNISNCASCHKSGNEHDIKMNGNRGNETKQKDLNNLNDYLKENKKKKDDD